MRSSRASESAQALWVSLGRRASLHQGLNSGPILNFGIAHYQMVWQWPKCGERSQILVVALNLVVGWPLASSLGPWPLAPNTNKTSGHDLGANQTPHHPRPHLPPSSRIEILLLDGSNLKNQIRSGAKQIQRPRSFCWKISTVDKNICDDLLQLFEGQVSPPDFFASQSTVGPRNQLVAKRVGGQEIIQLPRSSSEGRMALRSSLHRQSRSTLGGPLPRAYHPSSQCASPTWTHVVPPPTTQVLPCGQEDSTMEPPPSFQPTSDHTTCSCFHRPITPGPTSDQ